MMDGITSDTENKSKTLDKKEYKFSTKSGVHCFVQWYMDFGNEFQPANMLF